MPYKIVGITFIISSIFFNNNMQDWDYSIQKTEKETFKVETFSDGFDVPWGMAFLPDGNLLVSDRSGDLWKIKKNGSSKIQIGGTPKVRSKGQGGLLDVEVHPKFNENSLVYLSFSDFLIDQKNFVLVIFERFRQIRMNPFWQDTFHALRVMDY